MSPQKTKLHKEHFPEKSWRNLSKENLIFAGILTCIVGLLIVTGIIKYNQSRDQALYAKTSTVLANNVCPGCGQWGVPACPYCKFGMQWNSAQGLYVCPRCQIQGTPYCPGCRRPIPLQSQGMIGCVPQNPGLTPQFASPPQNGASLVA